MKPIILAALVIAVLLGVGYQFANLLRQLPARPLDLPPAGLAGASVLYFGALACWEHYNPLARYALMAQHEEIHIAQFPGSLVGPIFGEQIEVTIRHHALESGCFVVNATGWLREDQIASITPNGQAP